MKFCDRGSAGLASCLQRSASRQYLGPGGLMDAPVEGSLRRHATLRHRRWILPQTRELQGKKDKTQVRTEDETGEYEEDKYGRTPRQIKGGHGGEDT